MLPNDGTETIRLPQSLSKEMQTVLRGLKET